MDDKSLQKYLGMAVDFTYYHHSNLQQKQLFPDDYWKHLLSISNIEYLTHMKNALEYALTTEDYCLNNIKSPHLNRYPIEDIRLFLEKFYAFLNAHINA